MFLKPNKNKTIITLIFTAAYYILGLYVTNTSTQLESICSGDYTKTNVSICSTSKLIPFENFYKYDFCCIPLKNIIFDLLQILIVGIVVYIIISVFQYLISKKR